MNPKQQRGVEILTRLDAGALEVGAAAEFLGVTPRQVRWLRARFRQRASKPSSRVTGAVPMVLMVWPAALKGINAIIRRRDKSSEATGNTEQHEEGRR